MTIVNALIHFRTQPVLEPVLAKIILYVNAFNKQASNNVTRTPQI